MIAGTVLEWCARYLSLTALLEKHDKERVFIAIIETGVFGKVFSILAPVSDEIRRSANLHRQDRQRRLSRRSRQHRHPLSRKFRRPRSPNPDLPDRNRKPKPAFLNG